jgi:hypothetical protein
MQEAADAIFRKIAKSPVKQKALIVTFITCAPKE